MKRTITRITAVLLIIATMFAFSGCLTREDLVFRGSWKGTIDLSTVIDESMKEILDEAETTGYLTDKVTVDILFDFNKDGTYSAKIDEESVENAVQKFSDIMKNLVREQVEILIADEGYYDVDAFFEENYGTDFDEYFENYIQGNGVADEIRESLSSEKANGKFIAKDGKLYTSDDVSNDPDMSEYIEYTIGNGKITLVKSSDSEDYSDGFFPVELEMN